MKDPVTDDGANSNTKKEDGSTMSDRKSRRQIRKLVQLLISRHGISSVYVEEIADCLECSRDVVEEELGLLWEQGILKPVFELHCCLCGVTIATHESPLFLAGGMVECPHCLNQSKYDLENVNRQIFSARINYCPALNKVATFT